MTTELIQVGVEDLISAVFWIKEEGKEIDKRILASLEEEICWSIRDGKTVIEIVQEESTKTASQQ